MPLSGGMPAVTRRCLLAALLLALAEGLRISADEPEDVDLEIGEAELEREASEGERGLGEADRDALAWEWAVTEAVQERHPIKPRKLLRSTRVVGAGGQGANRTLRWVYGAHHKAGTVLLRQLAAEQADVLGVEGCYSMGTYGWLPKRCPVLRRKQARLFFRCSLVSQWLQDLHGRGLTFRTAHIIRDPIAMVVSGYIYHQKNEEDSPSILKPFRNASMLDALAAEASFVLEHSGKQMVDTFLHYPPNSLHVRLEDFTSSSSSYDETVQVLYDHMAGDIVNASQRTELMTRAVKHDLKRGGKFVPVHVADVDRTEEVRKVVDQLPPDVLAKLKEMRRTLGYE